MQGSAASHVITMKGVCGVLMLRFAVLHCGVLPGQLAVASFCGVSFDIAAVLAELALVCCATA